MFYYPKYSEYFQRTTESIKKACVWSGKYRGKHRYVNAWVRWDTAKRENPVFESFEVDDEFAERRGLN